MTAFNDYHNAQVNHLPAPLKQLAIEHDYDSYTPAEHALWRFLMRQDELNYSRHSIAETTHWSKERIPGLQEVNDALGRISWGAVAVGNLISPLIRMAFLSHRVLPVSPSIRFMVHIRQSYTPDFFHAAALSALLFTEPDYLYHIGLIGSKAIYSQMDLKLYEAIENLLLLKKADEPDPAAIRKAEKLIDFYQKNSEDPSEIALLNSMYQWSVEYGLSGTSDNYIPYGAAFRSSLNEYLSLQDSEIKKHEFSSEALSTPLKIGSTQQHYLISADPQSRLHTLNEFANRMAFVRGGAEGILKAIESQTICTAVYTSGLQVSGVFCDLRMDLQDRLQFIKTQGPTVLSFRNKQLENQGKKDHADGFSSPVGRLKDFDKALEDATAEELEALGIIEGRQAVLNFESGLTLRGTIDSILRRESRIILITFSNASLKDESGNIYFEPSWGKFDMAVGEKIISVYAGTADPDHVEEIQSGSARSTPPTVYDKKTLQYHELFRIVRNCRERRSGLEQLPGIWQELKTNYREDWLCALEILEIFEKENKNQELAREIRIYLELKASNEAEINQLIRNGFKLLNRP